MARVLLGGAVPEQRPVLQGCPSRSNVFRRPIHRSFQVSPLVVRRVGGGARGRPTTHCARKAGFPTGTTLGPVLAWTIRKGLRKVSE